MLITNILLLITKVKWRGNAASWRLGKAHILYNARKREIHEERESMETDTSYNYNHRFRVFIIDLMNEYPQRLLDLHKRMIRVEA